jgi:hypothetical protein
MKDTTKIRIKVPKALYESIQQELNKKQDMKEEDNLEEAGMGVEYAWIPGALAALGIVGAMAKEIKAYMVQHKLKGLEGIYKAYKAVGGKTSSTIDKTMGGGMEEMKKPEVKMEKKDALAEAIKKVLDKRKEEKKKKESAAKKEDEKKAADKKKEDEKKKKEAEAKKKADAKKK